MKRSQVLGLVRHVLTFAGGYVVAKGWGSDAMVGEIIGGVMTLIGGVWSLVSPEKSDS